MSNETNYFNLHVTGLGYLNNVREVQTRNGSMLCCSINALTGATDNPGYTRFDIMVVGKESSELILRCQKAIAEEKKVLLGFPLSNLSADVFTLTKGEHAGEVRPSLKARLIKVNWIKIGSEMVYKEEKPEPSVPSAPDVPSPKQFGDNQF
ncbi:TPA: DUF3577 domain-containing protein [Klebsiella pneumoniae]|nr:DUF3577 domain-containing protein [Klebsiella pneumoniae]